MSFSLSDIGGRIRGLFGAMGGPASPAPDPMDAAINSGLQNAGLASGYSPQTQMQGLTPAMGYSNAPPAAPPTQPINWMRAAQEFNKIVNPSMPAQPVMQAANMEFAGSRPMEMPQTMQSAAARQLEEAMRQRMAQSLARRMPGGLMGSMV
jgi:hypothetical protein